MIKLCSHESQRHCKGALSFLRADDHARRDLFQSGTVLVTALPAAARWMVEIELNAAGAPNSFNLNSQYLGSQLPGPPIRKIPSGPGKILRKEKNPLYKSQPNTFKISKMQNDFLLSRFFHIFVVEKRNFYWKKSKLFFMKNLLRRNDR